MQIGLIHHACSRSGTHPSQVLVVRTDLKMTPGKIAAQYVLPLPTASRALINTTIDAGEHTSA